MAKRTAVSTEKELAIIYGDNPPKETPQAEQNLLPAVVEPQSETVIHYPPETLRNLGLTTPQVDLITTKYVGASTLQLTPTEEEKLSVPVDLLDINVRPDGLIYYPQVFVRERLNDAFGRGQWSLIEHQVIKDEDHNKIYFEGSLYVRGCFVAKAIGEANYFPTNYKGEPNKMFSWASAHESAKSDCIVRCGKDLGIGKELWQPRFSPDFLKDFCVKVWRTKTGGYGDKVGSWQWRMKDSEPFFDEINDTKQPPKQEQHIVELPQEPKAPKSDPKTELEKCLSMAQLGNTWNKLTKEEKIQFESIKDNQKEKIRVLTLTQPLTELSSIFEIEEKLNFIKTRAELDAFTRMNFKVLESYGDESIDKKYRALQNSLA